jgi:hypothetical protein
MGGAVQKYVIPGLMAAGGAVSEVFAPGNPIGLSMVGSGVGQLAGEGIGQLAGGPAGNKLGQSLGGALGPLYYGMPGGGLTGGGGGGAGMVAPGTAGTPSMANIGAAMQQNPALAGINPSMVTGVSQGMAQGPVGAAGPASMPSMGGDTPGGTGQPSNFQTAMAGLGPVGTAYMDYMQKMKLLKQGQKTEYAAPHSSAGGQTSALSMIPQQGIQIPNQW